MEKHWRQRNKGATETNVALQEMDRGLTVAEWSLVFSVSVI